MKALLIVAVVVAAAVLLGWVSFFRDNGDPSVRLNTDAIRADAEAASETAEKGARAVSDASRRAVDEVKRTDVDVDVRRESAEGR